MDKVVLIYNGVPSEIISPNKIKDGVYTFKDLKPAKYTLTHLEETENKPKKLSNEFSISIEL